MNKVTRCLTLPSGRTSIRMEPEFWTALDEIARREGATLYEIVADVDGDQGQQSRTSKLRVVALEYFRRMDAARRRTKR